MPMYILLEHKMFNLSDVILENIQRSEFSVSISYTETRPLKKNHDIQGHTWTKKKKKLTELKKHNKNFYSF
jgi:hypothetical protein